MKRCAGTDTRTSLKKKRLKDTPGERKPQLLIIGLGNTILCDDAAGVVVARGVYEAVIREQGRDAAAFVEASYAGWRLVDILTGYRRVIIIDSILTGKGSPGECYQIKRKKIDSIHLQSSHGLGLEEAIELSRRNGFAVPEKITIYAIEVLNPFEFGEKMSPEIERKIPDSIRQIVDAERLLRKKSPKRR